MSNATVNDDARALGEEPQLSPYPLPLRFLIGAWFWGAGISITVVLYFVCCAIQLLVKLGLRPQDGRDIHNIAVIWGRAMIVITPGWRLTIEGAENVPQGGGPFIIVANHESISDIFAMYFLGVQFRWLAKASVFRLPFVGHAMHWARYVPVRRGEASSQKLAMDESAQRLAVGVPMFFFPEGTRSTDGQIKGFKSGAFRLARDARVPVLPVAIHGAADMLSKGSGLPGRSHIRIKVLPLLPPPGEGEDLTAYAAEARARIIAAHAGLKRT